MAREQQIVARNFLGLGHNIEKTTLKGVGEALLEKVKEEEMTNQAGMVGIGLSIHPFQDAESTSIGSSKVPSDHSGQGIVSAFPNGDLNWLASAHDSSFGGEFGHLGGPLNAMIGNLTLRENVIRNDVAGRGVGDNFNSVRASFTGSNHAGVQTKWFQVGSPSVVKEEDVDGALMSNERERMTATGNYMEDLTDSEYRRFVKERGMWHPWNKSAVMQQVASLESLHEEKPLEKSGQVFTEKLAPHGCHPSQILDGNNLIQGNASCGQYGESGNLTSKDSSSYKGNRSENQMTAQAWHFGGAITRPGIRPVGPITAYSPEKSVNAQLTIFYAGTVNVYDDVPAEKAQAIMLLAGSNISWSAKAMNYSGVQNISTMPPVATTSLSRPVSPPPCRPVSTPLPVSRTQSPSKLHLSMQAGQIGGSPQPAAAPSQASHNCGPGGSKQVPSSTPSTPSALPACPPTVPRALPQARKASLARFLEKRKERVFSKMPYPIKKGFADSVLSQGDKLCLTSVGGTGFDEKMENTCGTEDRAGALIEDVATSEMETEEQGWLQTSDTQRRATETETVVQISSVY